MKRRHVFTSVVPSVSLHKVTATQSSCPTQWLAWFVAMDSHGSTLMTWIQKRVQPDGGLWPCASVPGRWKWARRGPRISQVRLLDTQKSVSSAQLPLPDVWPAPALTLAPSGAQGGGCGGQASIWALSSQHRAARLGRKHLAHLSYVHLLDQQIRRGKIFWKTWLTVV